MLTHPGVLLVNYYRTDYTLDAKNPTPGFRERLAQDDGVRWDTLVPLQPWAPPGPTTRAKRMGFYFHREPPMPVFEGSFTTTTVAAPMWALATPFALIPLVHLRRTVRRRRRATRGLCPSCGYDLRASPETCPECGVRVPATASDRDRGAAGDAERAPPLDKWSLRADNSVQ